MADSQRTRGRRVPLRTIDDLERRGRAAVASERDATRAVATLLRELAIRLPDESRLIRKFADQAGYLDAFADPALYPEGPAASVSLTLDAFTRALVEHFEQAGVAVES